jgi:nucleotide-binding universal stress UspA family protein
MAAVLLVLTPTRYHAKVVDFALEMARREKQVLAVLYVVDTRFTDTLADRISDTAFLGDKVSEDFEKVIIAQYMKVGHQRLEEIKQRAKDMGAECQTREMKGDLVTESLKAARELKAGAIVISRAERLDFARRLFGSTTEELREKAPYPVFVIDESGAEHHGRHHSSAA